MKMQSFKALIVVSAVTLSAAANADTRIIEMWDCEVNEGSTIEQVKAANSKWLVFMNSKVKGGGIKSAVMTTVVGTSTRFQFLDSYPSMTAWVETKAVLKTPEGVAVEAAIVDSSTCPTNTLHESTDS